MLGPNTIFWNFSLLLGYVKQTAPPYSSIISQHRRLTVGVWKG